MGRRAHRVAFRWKLILSGAVGLSLVAAITGTAATVDDENLQSATRFAKVDPSLLESIGQHGQFLPASLSTQQVSVVLELNGAPVAVQDAEAKTQGRKLSDSDKQAIREQLKADQDKLNSGLASAGAEVVGQMQDAYNGVHVTVEERNLAQLAALPGVKAIHSVQSYVPDNVHGVPFVGAPTAWQNTGATGKDVNVAIIDTGIDYTHADFGGPGTVDAWNAAKATSTSTPNPAYVGPLAPKVKKGYDFVGDAYNANIPGSKPMPDPNPLDCFGHGTHTAGTLAGFGVLSNGSTFNGTYDASTINSHTWTVGPGVAPQANLFVYRVFGCAGSSNVVDLAINRAIADGADVISMSLGSPLGGTDDPTSVASQNAFNDGIAVVASAGNNGSGAYVVGSPSTDNGVLSVAAIDGSVPNYPGAHLTLAKAGGAAGGSIDAQNSNAAALPSGALPVKVLRNADGTVSLGCNPAEYTGTAGMVVVTKRGTCARVARAIYGQKAGAAAVAMINTSSGYPPFEGDITSNPDTGEAYNVTIPFLGVQGPPAAADATTLVAADGGKTALTPTVVINSGYKKAASFTSGGPRNPDSAPKPDVMAPGVSVASAGMGTGFKAAVMSGTSMACPMTAGIAALVKQVHHDWTGKEIKAAIMNTADPSLNTGYNLRIAGSGVVQAQNAINSTVLATTPDSLDSLAFDYAESSTAYVAHKTFTLANDGSHDATYDLSVVGNGSQRGASITVSPSMVSVPAHMTKTVTVSLSMPASAFAALPSDDTFAGLGLGAVISIRGEIVATRDASDTSSDHRTLRVPYIFIPRGTSNVNAGTPGPWVNTSSTNAGTPGHTITANLPISNNGLHSGSADLYAWGIHKASDLNHSSIDVRDVGLQVQLPTADNGIAAGDRGLVFVVNTYGRATNQVVDEFDVVISVNGDKTPDFVLVGYDLGQVLAGSFDGIYASFTINAKTGALVDAFYADAPMNGSIVELPTLASDLGLTQKTNGIGDVKNEGITYSVDAFSVVSRGTPDFTRATTINPFSPAVSSGDFEQLASGGTTNFTLTVDTDQQRAQPALGWIVAATDNANGAEQAREVRAP